MNPMPIVLVGVIFGTVGTMIAGVPGPAAESFDQAEAYMKVGMAVFANAQPDTSGGPWSWITSTFNAATDFVKGLLLMGAGMARGMLGLVQFLFGMITLDFGENVPLPAWFVVPYSVVMGFAVLWLLIDMGSRLVQSLGSILPFT